MKESTIRRKAHDVFHHPNVQKRIAELQAEHRKEHNITIEWMTQQYFEVIAIAKNERKPEAMRGALDSLGKLHGLIVDRKTLNVKGNIEHNLTTKPTSNTVEWLEPMYARGSDSAHEKPLLN